MKNLLLIALAFFAFNVNAQNITLKAIADGPKCNGAATGSISLFVDGGTAPYTYAWSNGETTPSISSLFAGTYSVTVNDNGGLISTTTVIIAEPARLALAGFVINVSSSGGSDGGVNLTTRGGTPDFSFAWSNGATTKDIGGLTAGDYTVTVTDGYGCQASLSETVTEMAPLHMGGNSNTQANNNNHSLLAPNGSNGTNMNVSVYPNPTSDFLRVKLNSTESQISVINDNGQIVAAQKFSSENPMVDVSNLPNGNYLVQVKTATETTTKNIVIAK